MVGITVGSHVYFFLFDHNMLHICLYNSLALYKIKAPNYVCFEYCCFLLLCAYIAGAGSFIDETKISNEKVSDITLSVLQRIENPRN